MRQIYCDNSSTSFPKAPGLGKVMGTHIDGNGYNISRGGYGKAYMLEREIMETREIVSDFFGAEKPQNVIFTPGATWGINILIKGVLKPGDHVITTAMEHNAVVRPLTQMAEAGIRWEKAPCDETGELKMNTLEQMIKPETRMILVIHGSNVCGTVNPIANVGKLCRKRGVFFAVDASQTVGSFPIDMKTSCIDALAFPAHKGLMGPQGIGGLLFGTEFAKNCAPLISGGTGSFSQEERMPEIMPDKFQPGTLNLPGIIGMKHALSFIRQEGLDAITEKKRELTGLFLEEIQNMKGVRLIGKRGIQERCAVVSLDFLDLDNGEVGYLLENAFGIMTRCGLHCAPDAHKTLGTFPTGTVRFSFGYFNTREEIWLVIDAINEILKEAG